MSVHLSNNKSRDASVPDSGNQIHHVNEPSYPTYTKYTPLVLPTSQRAVRRYPTQIPTNDTHHDPRETEEEYTSKTAFISVTAASSIDSSSIERLENEVKRNKKKIEELQKKLENRNQNCFEKTKTLRDEIRKLREENYVLKQKLQTLERKSDKQQKEHQKDQEEMKYSYQWLEDERDQEKKDRKSMETELKCLTRKYDSMKTEYDTKLKCLTGNEDVLCLRQLCVDVQVHIYKYVMREDFDEICDTPDIATIENFIDEEIEDPERKTRAEERLKIIKGKDFYREALGCLGTLKSLKKIGNNVAHPELDEEKINKSIENLQKDKKLKKKV